jgi:hypothetical protein
MGKLLLVSPTPTHPTNAGNRSRIRKWLEVCVEEGVDFHLAFFRDEPGDEAAMARCWGEDRCTFLDYLRPRRSFQQRLSLRLARAFHGHRVWPHHIDDWRRESLVNNLRDLAKRIKPSCAQVEYAFFSHLFNCFDKSVFRILDTHDIIAGRDRMFLKVGRGPEWFYTTERQEAIGLNRADCIVAIQDQDRAYFKELTRKPVVTVGHMVELRAPTMPCTGQPTAVFMGSANAVNQDAVGFLLEKIWPAVKKSVPDANLEVYGRVCAHATNCVPGVRLVGEVADVCQAYERAWLVLCPLRLGTGLKIKSIEALGQGKALVSTTSGCTGIENGEGKAFLRGDLADDFARHCINVLADRKLRHSLELGACQYATAWNVAQRSNLVGVLASAGLR